MKRVRCPKCENFITFDETRYADGQSLVFQCPDCGEKHFIFGFRDKDSILLKEKFEELGEVIITTDDGSFGLKKYPHEVLETLMDKGFEPNLICTCGPVIMMDCVEKVFSKYGVGELYKSYESTMGCGIGACLGCRIETTGGSFLVCKEGPVFRSNGRKQ